MKINIYKTTKRIALVSASLLFAQILFFSLKKLWSEGSKKKEEVLVDKEAIEMLNVAFEVDEKNKDDVKYFISKLHEYEPTIFKHQFGIYCHLCQNLDLPTLFLGKSKLAHEYILTRKMPACDDKQMMLHMLYPEDF